VTESQRRERIRALARRVASTYREVGQINRIGEKNLPSRDTVARLVECLLTLVFPGYYGDRVARDTDLELWAGAHLDRVAEDLADVVERTLRFCSRHQCSCRELWLETTTTAGEPDFSAVAQRLAFDYLDHLPAIREILRTDVQAAYEGDPAATNNDEIILCYPGTLAIAVHRLAHPLCRLGVPLIPRIMTEWAHARTGVDIHPGARIGESFFIDHGTGVVVGETTEIGARVKLYQGVTLGALSFRRNPDGTLVKGGKRHPTVEDDVTVYAGATILGGETVIGRGAVIGGGAWITSSVPAGEKVLKNTVHAAAELPPA